LLLWGQHCLIIPDLLSAVWGGALPLSILKNQEPIKQLVYNIGITSEKTVWLLLCAITSWFNTKAIN